MPWEISVAAPQPLKLTTIFSGEDGADVEEPLRTPRQLDRHNEAVLAWRTQRTSWQHWFYSSSSSNGDESWRERAEKDSDSEPEDAPPRPSRAKRVSVEPASSTSSGCMSTLLVTSFALLFFGVMGWAAAILSS